MDNSIHGIQIIGTQRSGSNLLRVILDQSPDVRAPHPPHILQSFVPLIENYAPLHEINYRHLVSDLLEYIRCNPVPWESFCYERVSTLSQLKNHSIYDLFRIVYEETARNKNSKYWCCKSMANYKYHQALESAGIQPKYIYLYRDGRDVAASFKRAIVGEKHVYQLARKWHADQVACHQIIETLGSERCFALRYENLIAHPKHTVKSVCNFLDIEFDEQMLQYYMSNESSMTASSGKMWSNLTQPVLKDNHHKFLTELSDTEIEIFELVAGDTLSKLGYPSHSHTSKKELLSESSIEKYEAENKQMKEKMQKINAHDYASRTKQRMILENVKKRKTAYEVIY